MIYLLLVFTIIHISFYLALLIGWFKIPEGANHTNEANFSVIVPVRNEETDIEKLLTCLEYQEYDKKKYEVIIVDDFSEDATINKVLELKDRFSMNLRIISLDNPLESGKKRALTKGIENASFDFILTTDADCQMGPQWLSSYSAKVEDNRFIAGPVSLKGSGLFANLQQIEFAGLIGFGAVTLSNNNPSMCSGANLGFNKEAFFEVGGYSNNLNIPSGDDEFLLYNIQKKYPGKVVFLKNKSAIVVTGAHLKLRTFINQRVRWISKWKHNKNLVLRLIAVVFFADYALLISSMLSGIMDSFILRIVAIVLLFRWVFNGLFLRAVHTFLGHRSKVFPLLIFQIIYPFHVLFMGVNSIFGHYTWKGRKY